MITIGRKFVLGCDEKPRKITGLPDGGRIKIRYRPDDFAKCYWSDGQSCRAFFMEWTGEDTAKAIESASNHNIR